MKLGRKGWRESHRLNKWHGAKPDERDFPFTSHRSNLFTQRDSGPTHHHTSGCPSIVVAVLLLWSEHTFMADSCGEKRAGTYPTWPLPHAGTSLLHAAGKQLRGIAPFTLSQRIRPNEVFQLTPNLTGAARSNRIPWVNSVEGTRAHMNVVKIQISMAMPKACWP